MSMIVYQQSGQLNKDPSKCHNFNVNECQTKLDPQAFNHPYCFWDKKDDICHAACYEYDGDMKTCTNPIVAAKLCILAGALNLLMGLFQLGFIVDFISHPVISGFCSAAAITIATGQIHHLFGIKAQRPFVSDVHDIFANLHTSHWPDVLMSVFCIGLTIFFGKLKSRMQKIKSKTTSQKVFWFIGACGNFMVILIATIIGFIVYKADHTNLNKITNSSTNSSISICMRDGHDGKDCLTLTGIISPNFPQPMIPNHFESNDIGLLAGGTIIVALLGYLESIAIAKAFARDNGYEVDPSQELVAIGAGNLVSGFFQAYPGTGSFSRTAVQATTGSKTPATGIITGSIVLISIQFLTKLMEYIPAAALSSIIIVAVVKMINFHIAVEMWRINKIDVLPWATSFFLCVFMDIEHGVGIGMIVNIAILLFHNARPRHCVLVRDPQSNNYRPIEIGEDNFDPSPIKIIRVGGSLVYTSGGSWKDFVLSQVEKGTTLVVVLDFTRAPLMDFSGVESVVELRADLAAMNIHVLCTSLSTKCAAMLEHAQFWSSTEDRASGTYETLEEATDAATAIASGFRLESMAATGSAESDSLLDPRSINN